MANDYSAKRIYTLGACGNCGKAREVHRHKDRACPLGRRRGVLGYLAFHSDSFYTPPTSTKKQSRK